MAGVTSVAIPASAISTVAMAITAVIAVVSAVIPTPAMVMAIIAVVMSTMATVVSTAVHHRVEDGPHNRTVHGLVYRLINRLVHGCRAVHHGGCVDHWGGIPALVPRGVAHRRSTASMAVLRSGAGANGRANSATHDRGIAAAYRLPNQSPCHST